ncbi:MAG: protein translocase subunit SecF [Thiotrichaceae bacterium]|nr:protein translocase subunit SecF [Thiotrichaceae bacterium]PCI11932.1 MAG: protein translocase subunit SecF [Thiotrichales bacterium]
MQIFNKEPSFDFMGKRKLALILSILLVIISIASLATRGLNFGIDFTGGTLIEVGYENSADLSEVRATLESAGYGDAITQHFGSSKDVLIRVPPYEGMTNADLSTGVLNALHAAAGAGEVEMRRVEFVGPQVGEELTEKGGLAMIYALFGILIYITLRFEKRFAVGSVVALVHDVIITLGIFSILRLEFDLTTLAAILAVIGYSLNDTIVVFDRIRENFRKMRKGSPVEVANRSINQMLSRTLVTSFTTLFVLLALFVLGGEIIHSFATALIIGIVVGTYSSVYVASATALALGVSKQDLMPVKKEGEDEPDILGDQP